MMGFTLRTKLTYKEAHAVGDMLMTMCRLGLDDAIEVEYGYTGRVGDNYITIYFNADDRRSVVYPFEDEV
jgi:hypothetical protein